MTNILHLDSSARGSESMTRRFTKELSDALATKYSATVTHRNLDSNTHLLTDVMVQSYFTPKDKRDAQASAAIAASDAVLADLRNNDIYVFGVPMYNFAMPGAFKAWADLAARAGETFKYTQTGPVGLLENKRAFIVVASGGVQIGSETDFLTPWLRHYFGFLGIQDTTILNATEEQIIAAINSKI